MTASARDRLLASISLSLAQIDKHAQSSDAGERSESWRNLLQALTLVETNATAMSNEGSSGQDTQLPRGLVDAVLRSSLTHRSGVGSVASTPALPIAEYLRSVRSQATVFVTEREKIQNKLLDLKQGISGFLDKSPEELQALLNEINPGNARIVID